MSCVQRDVCSAKPFMTLPYTHWGFLTGNTWVTSIWKRLSPYNITLHGGWTYPLQQHGNMHLGDAIADMAKDDRKLLHKLFKTMQVTTLADITTADGTRIHPDIIELRQIETRKSKVYWGNETYDIDPNKR